MRAWMGWGRVWSSFKGLISVYYTEPLLVSHDLPVPSSLLFSL